jgi:hypothetical protein
MSDGPTDAADRVALRALVDAYAMAADAKRYRDMARCFSDQATFTMCMTPGDDQPTAVHTGAAEIEAAMASLDAFVATTHLVGAQVIELDGDRATGQATCVARHILVRPSGRKMLTMGIRYEDRFGRHAGRWLIEERRLVVVWQEFGPMAG